MKDVIKVSTVAFNAKWGEKERNLNRMTGYIEAAASEGSNIIVFPEMGLTGYDDEEDKPKPEKMQYKLAETVPGKSSEVIAELTKNWRYMPCSDCLRGIPMTNPKYITPPVYAAPMELLVLTIKFTCHIRNRTGHQEEQPLLFLTRSGPHRIRDLL